MHKRWTLPFKIAWSTLVRANRNEVLIYGGYAAYTTLLAFFPFILFLIAMAGLLGNAQAAEKLVENALTIMPEQIVSVLAPVVRDIVSNESPSLLTFGALGTLWVTSSGVEGVRFGLNQVYKVEERRAFWKRRLQSIVLVFMGSLVFFILALVVIIWPLMMTFVPQHIFMALHNVKLLNLYRFAMAAFMLTSLFGLFYYYLPNRRMRIRYVAPGAALATTMWLGLAALFSLYLKHFGRYDVTYGSIGGLIITLIFFHYSASTILLGAQLNIVLEETLDPKDSA